MLQLHHLILIWLLAIWTICLTSDTPTLMWNALTALHACVAGAISTMLAAARHGLARSCACTVDACRIARCQCFTRPCTAPQSPAGAATTSESTISTSGCLSSYWQRQAFQNKTCCVLPAQSASMGLQPLPKTVSARYCDL